MHWRPSADRREEEAVAKRLRNSSKFYRFLWEVRGELFDAALEKRLIECYAPRGQAPCPPALLAMVMLLQRYDGVSDADAVDAAENDRRWQLVLGTLGSDVSPFGQGSLVRFRTRMIAHDLDKLLVERTVALAKKTKKFGWQRLRVALDSSPLAGAGRVEDTWNLIGRAMSKVVHLVSVAIDVDEEAIIRSAKLEALTEDSVKAALDIDWDDEEAQHEALNRLVDQVGRLDAWVAKRAKKEADKSPLKDALALLHRVVDQDTEPDPDGGGGVRIVEGVAHDRIISIGDPEMRHGRKSRSVRIDGYKRHISVANGIILSTAVEPANVREYAPAERLLAEASAHGDIDTVDIDRGYLASPAVIRLHRSGVVINSRAWNVANKGLFTKDDFDINLELGRVTCPAGSSAPITNSGQVFFGATRCGACPLKSKCTNSPQRSLTIHEAEDLLILLRARRRTRRGRREIRERVVVEHRLARVGAIQGDRARYRGARKNELDVNRAAAIANLHVIAGFRASA
jgi:IS5 family transposase